MMSANKTIAISVIAILLLGLGFANGFVAHAQSQPHIQTIQCDPNSSQHCSATCDFGFHWNTNLQQCTPILNPNNLIQQPQPHIQQIVQQCQTTDQHCDSSCSFGYQWNAQQCVSTFGPSSSVQQPHIQQVGLTCHRYNDGVVKCWPTDESFKQQPMIQQIEDCSNCAGGNNDCTCSTIEQSVVQPIVYTSINCFWSNPVQCNQE